MNTLLSSKATVFRKNAVLNVERGLSTANENDAKVETPSKGNGAGIGRKEGKGWIKFIFN